MREKFVLPDVDGSHVNPSHAGLQTSQQPCQYPVATGKKCIFQWKWQTGLRTLSSYSLRQSGNGEGLPSK